MKEEKDYYKLLEIDKDASDREIKLAYRRLAKKYHPDLNKTDPRAKEKFIEIKNAYDTLRDPIKRKVYDQAGHNPRNIDLSDLFRRTNSNYNRFRQIMRDIFGRKNENQYYKPPPESMYI